MNGILYLLIGLLITAEIVGCKVNELPVPKHPPGERISSSVNLEPDYKWQIFYNLEKKRIVSQNLRSSWDIGFECRAEGFHVITNVGKFMQVYKTGETDILSVIDTTGFGQELRWDEPNGVLSETAIGDWRINKPVYILDLGYGETGNHLGFKKIRITEYTAISYTIEYANLNSTQANQVITRNISKDSLYNFSFFSFATNATVLVEPPKSDWDLVFTQYIHIFREASITPYWVTGCMLNRNNTWAILDTSYTFETLTQEIAITLPLSQDINIIGYNWKVFTGEDYSIQTNFNYLLRDQKGIYYKLHFLDFYTPTGQKGCPTWEYQKL